ncbi:hypothetical protein AVEN_266718-1 [Araneus ventricosus]|uniref:Uncharacterized protein n=1 Tax=Araneus ventricosus TaxID=182803 RepID=A0A4Y2ASE0_ARAVE|nr:hypothetical protein AVEN_266718-1 [Araneus ventricosus]
MYDLSLQFCKYKNIHEKLIAKKWQYFDVSDKQFKLSFKPPEIDTCDICDSLQARLKDNCLSQTDRDKLIAEYDLHLTESARRYTIKSEDIKMSKTRPTHKVLTGDQQKCLPTPLLINRISFCKRKLWTLNYALLDSSDESVHCMLRYESKPVRGGEEISSVVLKWSESVTPTSDVNEITMVR